MRYIYLTNYPMYLLAMQMGRLHQTTEVVSLLAHLVPFLAAFLLGTILNILFKYLFAFARRQQQIPRVKHDLVQLLLPRAERGHLYVEKI